MAEWFKRGDGTLCGRRVTAAVVGSVLAVVQAVLGWGCVETGRQARGADGLTGLTVPMAGGGRTAAEARAETSTAVNSVRDYVRRVEASEPVVAEGVGSAGVVEQEVAWRDRAPVEGGPETLGAPPTDGIRGLQERAGVSREPAAQQVVRIEVAGVDEGRVGANGAERRGALEAMSEAELVKALAERVAAGDRSELDKAVVGALLRAMAVGDAETGVEAELLAGLPAGKRERLALFEQLVRETRAGMLATDGSLSQSEVGRRVMRVFGELPITVAKMELCRRVEGYGVYEPLGSRVFAAGRAKRAVVYLELENFTRQAVDSGYEVKLRQEVTLYKAEDGMAVWRQKPVEIRDRSKNPRRDFFVVQVVSLPRDLGVGRYVLKVKGQDLHGGMHYARSVPIEVSASGGGGGGADGGRLAVGR
ncbi:MAG: hypothetical protein AAF750_14895 [Planctomycetota bacterium]